MGTEIFISYCRKDIQKAKIIKEEIERSTSARCWMDLDGIESGSQFEDVIISAIDNARVVIFLLSDNSMQSKWTKDEVRYAYETRKKIIPVNIDNCTPSGWFLFKFSGYDVIDISDSFQKKKLYENLAEWIVENEKGEDFTVVEKKMEKSTFFDPYCFLGGGQYLVFGSILLIMSSMFFFGLLTMKEGNMAMRFNILLCLFICGTLYSTYLLFTKQKKIAVLFIVILDVFEIVLLCEVAYQITKYASLSGYHYRSFPYIQLCGLGWKIIHKGGLFVTAIMELLALLHFLYLLAVLYIRINGDRLWDRLK